MGDPRSFKRPVRVTVPRALPTDDVLVLRDKKGDPSATKKAPTLVPLVPIKDALELEIVETSAESKRPANVPVALVLHTLDEVRAAFELPLGRVGVRALVSTFIPSHVVAALAAEGIPCFACDEATLELLHGQKTLSLPAPQKWAEGVAASAGKQRIQLTWLAKGAEQAWTLAGGLRGAIPAKKP